MATKMMYRDENSNMIAREKDACAENLNEGLSRSNKGYMPSSIFQLMFIHTRLDEVENSYYEGGVKNQVLRDIMAGGTAKVSLEE